MIDKSIKICRCCKVSKELDKFHTRSSSTDGKESICKECNKYILKRVPKPLATKEFHKVCNTCLEEKHINFFHKHKGGAYGVDSRCKECSSKYVNKRQKESGYIKKYYNENKKQIIIRTNEYIRKRCKIDPVFKLKNQLRGRFYEVLRAYVDKGVVKKQSILKYLGCSAEEYKIHLESQFRSEMNWINHGKIWEIDHILPISSFDFTKEEEIYKCFNYKNTQPLFITTEIAENYGYNEIGNRNKQDLIL